jgi:hypothetical protein
MKPALSSWTWNQATPTGPRVDTARFAMPSENPLERMAAAYVPDMAGELDTPADELAEQLHLNREQHALLCQRLRELTPTNNSATDDYAIRLAAQKLAEVVSYIFDGRGNVRLRYHALCLAAGMPGAAMNCSSYTELAKKLKCTRAAISGSVIKLQQRLGLEMRNPFQKTFEARESSRLAALRSWQHRQNHQTQPTT